ncbi:MAG: hypothetical protein WCZ65_08535 [Lysobacteraceae bacterium]
MILILENEPADGRLRPASMTVATALRDESGLRKCPPLTCLRRLGVHLPAEHAPRPGSTPPMPTNAR